MEGQRLGGPAAATWRQGSRRAGAIERHAAFILAPMRQRDKSLDQNVKKIIVPAFSPAS
jgi:hypothetical protein